MPAKPSTVLARTRRRVKTAPCIPAPSAFSHIATSGAGMSLLSVGSGSQTSPSIASTVRENPLNTAEIVRRAS
jgi:hypothetical protein